MEKLDSLICSVCGGDVPAAVYTPSPNGGPPAATSYEACLRRCPTCGTAFSNAQDLASVVTIHADPRRNVPEPVRDGLLDVLCSSLNVRNRENKRRKFAFETSEDAVAWTIFSYLREAELLRRLVAAVTPDLSSEASKEPALLLWGSPIPIGDARSRVLRVEIERYLADIGERPDSLSEPDVTLDLGDNGLIIIEVKYRSPNDEKRADYPGWPLYARDTDAFADAVQLRHTGHYELARYWRIGSDMAGGRPFVLVNLGFEALFTGPEGERLDAFERSLRTGESRRFVRLPWPALLESIGDKPEWLRRYIADRGLLSPNEGLSRAIIRKGNVMTTLLNSGTSLSSPSGSAEALQRTIGGLSPDTVSDWNREFAKNQVLLIHLPKVNSDSFVHLALWNGSFDVRDYLRSGSAKLRDQIGLRESDISQGASRLVLRVKSRPDVNQIGTWVGMIRAANESFLDRAKASGLPPSIGPQGTAFHNDDAISRFGVAASQYGLTQARMARVQNNLRLLDKLYSYRSMKEDSCVAFYFILLDRFRQFKLGFHQRVGGDWRPFSQLFTEIGRNVSQEETLLSRLAPFSGLDPYAHFVSFELQLNNNHAIGNPTLKTNQADATITDVRNRVLYVVEAKMTAEPRTDQLDSLLACVEALTAIASPSVFRGFEGRVVLLLDRDDDSPIEFHGKRIAVITWKQIISILKAEENKGTTIT